MQAASDVEVLRTVVYAFTAVLLTALVVFGVVGGVAFSKIERGGGKSFGLLFSRGNFLRIFTVVLCIFAVVVLATSGKLNEGAVAVISGIAGFVLGGVSKDAAEPKSSEPPGA